MLPPSWVQMLRRISGADFAFFGLRGCLRLLAAGQKSVQCWLARGASSLLPLGQTIFLSSDFSPPSPNRVIHEHFPEASTCSGVPRPFHACKSKSERFLKVPPGQGTFLLQPPWVVPGIWIWHLDPPKPLLRTEGISANLLV